MRSGRGHNHSANTSNSIDATNALDHPRLEHGNVGTGCAITPRDEADEEDNEPDRGRQQRGRAHCAV
jgi:hypothetical protein